MASSKGKWESFFVGAGVPQRLSAEYAATFSSNRMRLDMLEELNKEMLRDLGVKVSISWYISIPIPLKTCKKSCSFTVDKKCSNLYTLKINNYLTKFFVVCES